MRYVNEYLAALRQIGWDHWDPIQIRRMDSTSWLNGAADEYDGYMLKAADMIVRGATDIQATVYLDFIAWHYIATGIDEGRSMKTVKAIRAYVDHYFAEKNAA